MSKRIGIIGDDEASVGLAAAVEAEMKARGKSGEISFATVGVPTPKLDCIGKGVSNIPCANMPAPHDDSMHDG